MQSNHNRFTTCINFFFGEMTAAEDVNDEIIQIGRSGFAPKIASCSGTFRGWWEEVSLTWGAWFVFLPRVAWHVRRRPRTYSARRKTTTTTPRRPGDAERTRKGRRARLFEPSGRRYGAIAGRHRHQARHHHHLTRRLAFFSLIESADIKSAFMIRPIWVRHAPTLI